MPQIHPPGEAQVDFGFADIIHDGPTILDPRAFTATEPRPDCERTRSGRPV